MATTFNDGDRGTEIRRKLNEFGAEMDGNVTAAAGSAQAAANSAGEADASATEAEGFRDETAQYKSDFEQAFGGLSYLAPVEYASAIDIDSAVKTVEFDGDVYAPLPSEVPFTTSGTFESDKFRLIQGVTTQQMASTAAGGFAANIGHNVVAVDSIADLLALPAGARRADLRYLVKSYHAGSDVGGGEFYWDASSTADDNGGTVFEVAGVATGRFVRVLKNGVVYTDYFGPDKTGGTSAAAEIIAAKTFAEDNGLSVIVNDGTYSMGANQLIFDKAMKFRGESRTGVVFVFSGLSDAAFHVAKNSSVAGANIGDFTITGSPSAGSISFATGGGISASCTDSYFSNIRGFNFELGLKQQYSWCNTFDTCRWQACTKPFDLGSQVNASTYITCSFVSFSVAGSFSNCEGLAFISPNIANFSGASAGFNLFQSNVVMNNPYFENPSAVLSLVGTSSESFSSSLRITGGVANPCDIRYVFGAVIIVENLRVQSGDGSGIKINGSDAVAPNVAPGFIRFNQFRNATNDQKILLDIRHERITALSNAYSGTTLSYELHRDYYTVTNSVAVNGFRVYQAFEIGKQYTILVAARRKDLAGNLTVRFDSNQPLGINTVIVPEDTEEFKLFGIVFVATGTVLRWLFQGTLQIKRIAVVEGVVETSYDLPKVDRWYATAAPTAGTWQRGDIVENSTPSAGGFAGWICTAGGSPGTWKGYGAIEA